MNNFSHYRNLTFSLLLLFTIVSCKHDKEHEYHSITDKIEVESKHYEGISTTSDKFIDGMNLIEVTENEITFLIPTRKDKIKSYKCTECHTQPLKQMQSNDIKKAHWNIKLKHANTDIMNCTTCHNGNNMDELVSITGHKIDFNKSFKQCSQCHQKQYDDWTGGAHGKRIESWASPRASMTCVNCHNPHSPSFETKWPERYNSRKVEIRK